MKRRNTNAQHSANYLPGVHARPRTRRAKGSNGEPFMRQLAPTRLLVTPSVGAWVVSGSLAIREDVAVAHDWARLAEAIRARRNTLRLSQRELAKSAGVTPTTVRNLEGGRDFKRVPPSLTSVEKALGWDFGSADAILNGMEPTLLSGSSDPDGGTVVRTLAPAGQRDSGLPTSVQAALDDGDTFATDVIDLSRPGEPFRLIVVAPHGNVWLDVH
jgi:transcriptional regulator with XRE-family HTH domain